MRCSVWLFASLILLFASSFCASYEPPPVEDYIPKANIVYYDIRGSTEEDLHKQMQWLGPVGNDGKTHWSSTKWDFSWNGDIIEDKSGNCHVYGAFVDYKIDVMFPRWIPPETASLELIAEWERLVKALAET